MKKIKGREKKQKENKQVKKTFPELINAFGDSIIHNEIASFKSCGLIKYEKILCCIQKYKFNFYYCY